MTMKDFFKQQLISLEKNTGLKQYEKLLEKDDWEKELEELLTVLCRVCNQFDYIPNEDKAKIIKQNVITDSEFQGFNARIVYKWLTNAKSIYFKEQAHIDTVPPENYKPLEGEARAAKLDEWLKALGDGMKRVPYIGPDEAKKKGAEWASPLEEKAIIYPYADQSVLEQHKQKVIIGRTKLFQERHPDATEKDLQAYLASFPEIKI